MFARLMTATLCAGLCGWAASAMPARANVMYDYTTTSASGGNPNPGQRFTGIPNLELTVTDAAYLSGSLNFGVSQCSGSVFPTTHNLGCGTVTGDPTGLVSLTRWDQFGSLGVNVSFLGNTVEGSLHVHSGESDYDMNSSGTTWTGFVQGSDAPFGNGPCAGFTRTNECTFTGYFVAANIVPNPQPVPEPASLALLGAAALALAATRRQLA